MKELSEMDDKIIKDENYERKYIDERRNKVVESRDEVKEVEEDRRDEIYE